MYGEYIGPKSALRMSSPVMRARSLPTGIETGDSSSWAMNASTRALMSAPDLSEVLTRAHLDEPASKHVS